MTISLSREGGIHWLGMMRMLIFSRLMTRINECGRLYSRNKAMLSLKANL